MKLERYQHATTIEAERAETARLRGALDEAEGEADRLRRAVALMRRGDP